MNQPPTLDFDYDTLTLAQALPWFKGSAMILVGCLLAGISGLFCDGLLDVLKPEYPGTDLVTA